ncbi:hypothetical protein FNH22_17690 [Fulvivirga sp. M361]|uniref:hypothetical protein n=1 Tax=Fulvivirga sp. M361 TaxID=2594266 RepID=UPI00117A3E36|nr:hypothetical protein [Fulvivirga sp. M361]TRX55994.1 hypothetical protein FNH22_17690 [Fulvivirga sp. M361]
MRKALYIVFILFFTCTGYGIAQSFKNDLSLLKVKVDSATQAKSISPLKSLFPKEKYFDTHFFHFSKQSFKSLSFPKNLFVTLDRINRSGRISYLYAHPIRKDGKGKVADPISYYKK